MAAVGSEQAGREEVHGHAHPSRPEHGPGGHRHGIEQALDTLHQHNRRSHQDQHRIGQRSQLGAATKTVGVPGRRRACTEPFSPPAQQEPGHIAQVVNRIPDQGQGAKGHPDQQLQGRESGVENHAPAEGCGRTEAVLVLTGVGLPLDLHRWMRGDRVGMGQGNGGKSSGTPGRPNPDQRKSGQSQQRKPPGARNPAPPPPWVR